MENNGNIKSYVNFFLFINMERHYVFSEKIRLQIAKQFIGICMYLLHGCMVTVLSVYVFMYI